jgi:outer membrane protein OmpA-like peptidoglycan-associated protein
MKKILSVFYSLSIASALAAQVSYEITKLPLNTSSFNEYAAMPYGNGLIFCSDRRTASLVSYTDDNSKTFSDIYFAAPGSGKASHFSSSIRTPLNEGPASFTSGGKKIYFTRNENTRQKSAASLGIYTADLVNGDWTNIQPFAHNSSKYACGHPALSEDGSTIYFISDMPGGYGGTDIYFSTQKDGQWQQPQNLGPAVNTPGNEMFPFVHIDGSLYYSSAWQPSSGGLDIFVTRYVNGAWERSRRLPAPVNSIADDFAYVCDPGGKKGYFSSNRDGSDDVYEFYLPLPSFEKCDSLVKNNYCFEFFQEGAAPTDSLPLAYEWDLGDGTKVKALETDHCFKGEGTYTIQLNVIDTLTGEVFYNEATYDLEIKDHEQVYIDGPDTCYAGSSIKLDGSKTNIKDLAVAAWYWDFGTGISDSGKIAQHVFAVPGRYDVMLGVTAADGMRKACVRKSIVVIDPSMKKVQPVTMKLEAPVKAIMPPPQPLEMVYKVEVASSKDKIPVEDKRFDKLEEKYSVEETFLPDKQVYSYTVGQERSLAATWPIYKDVRSKGYSEAMVRSYADDIVSLDNVGSLSKSEMNKKTVRIDNALFDAGQHALTGAAKEEMDKLYRLMTGNSELTATISAHTDNEGSESANQELSEKRAAAIVEYLVSKGIEKARLEAKGFGESQPVADNSTAEGRKQNRRVEVKIDWE